MIENYEQITHLIIKDRLRIGIKMLREAKPKWRLNVADCVKMQIIDQENAKRILQANKR